MNNIPTLGINEFWMRLQADSSFQYHQIRGARFIEKLHKHDFFFFLLIEEGSGTHTVDFVEHHVTANQIHLLFPDQVHSWKLGDDTVAQQIMVSQRIFETFTHSLLYGLVHYQNHLVLKLSLQVFRELLYEFKVIESELISETVLWDIISARCKIIAQMVSREAEQAFEDLKIYHAKPVLFEYNTMINTHFRDQKSVSFYAEKLKFRLTILISFARGIFILPPPR